VKAAPKLPASTPHAYREKPFASWTNFTIPYKPA
jgi:hypothetical protein